MVFVVVVVVSSILAIGFCASVWRHSISNAAADVAGKERHKCCLRHQRWLIALHFACLWCIKTWPWPSQQKYIKLRSACGTLNRVFVCILVRCEWSSSSSSIASHGIRFFFSYIYLVVFRILSGIVNIQYRTVSAAWTVHKHSTSTYLENRDRIKIDIPICSSLVSGTSEIAK